MSASPGILSSLFTRVLGYAGPRPLSTGEQFLDGMSRQLTFPQVSQTRWQLSDLENAIIAADQGNLRIAARLCKSLRRDGVLHGVLATRTEGLVQLPLRFKGDPDVVTACERDFREVFPSPELALIAGDGRLLGAGVGEFVQIAGAKPVLRRLDPEPLQYRASEDRWYYQSIHGTLPVNPGDGRWVLHTPGGVIQPWSQGLWMALGRAFIAKEHAYFLRENYSSKLANAARVAVSPQGASEDIKLAWFKKVAAWGVNTVFGVPSGYDVRLLESNGRGFEVFQETIDCCNKEISVTLAGQAVTLEGGSGFVNAGVFKAISSDLVQSDADALAATLNIQGLPVWANECFGAAARVECAWDVTPPKDLATEAASLSATGAAIKVLNEALERYGKEVNIDEIARRFGVPVKDVADAARAALRVIPGGSKPAATPSSSSVREAA